MVEQYKKVDNQPRMDLYVAGLGAVDAHQAEAEDRKQGNWMIEQDSAFTAAFEEIRGLIRADGGDLQVVSFDGSTVAINLILETANCADCIMPRRFLEQVALDIFHRRGVKLELVSIRDPREMSMLPTDVEGH